MRCALAHGNVDWAHAFLITMIPECNPTTPCLACIVDARPSTRRALFACVCRYARQCGLRVLHSMVPGRSPPAPCLRTRHFQSAALDASGSFCMRHTVAHGNMDRAHEFPITMISECTPSAPCLRMHRFQSAALDASGSFCMRHTVAHGNMDRAHEFPITMILECTPSAPYLHMRHFQSAVLTRQTLFTCAIPLRTATWFAGSPFSDSDRRNPPAPYFHFQSAALDASGAFRMRCALAHGNMGT